LRSVSKLGAPDFNIWEKGMKANRIQGGLNLTSGSQKKGRKIKCAYCYDPRSTKSTGPWVWDRKRVYKKGGGGKFFVSRRSSGMRGK